MTKNESGDLRLGLIGSAEMTVTEVHTASSMGSGRMPVLATPAMVVLMEAAAQNAVDRYLPPEHQTVGTRLDIRHDGATPVGMKVVATAELIGIDGRVLTFRLTVRDETEAIGEGVHERAISSVATFNRLLRQKRKRVEAVFSNTDAG